MKLDRLIGILSILLQRDKVTMSYLAETFEVSRRTISRDVEALCRAGIPIATSQGVGGGVSIMGGGRLDRALLTSNELQAILAGLRSLDSVSGSHRYGQLMEKLAGPGLLAQEGGVLIDLAAWHKGSLSLRKLTACKRPLVQDAWLAFTIMPLRGSPSGWWSPAMWSTSGAAGTCGAGAGPGRTTGSLSWTAWYG